MKKKQSTISLEKVELLSRLVIQERSLKAFAREIYENIGQILSLLKLELGTIDLKNEQESKEKLVHSSALVSKAIKDLRSLAKQLSPDDIIKKGFADSISFELDRLGKAGICDAGFRSDGEYYKLDAARELIIFGIIQGLICKVLTRGNTRELQIEVSYLPDQIIICTKFKVADTDIEKFIKGIIADNKFVPGAGRIRAGIDVKTSGDEGIIGLTIKRI